jgi:exodeoxyribonuclease III
VDPGILARSAIVQRMRIVSWNVNGIRACWDSALREYLEKERPDIVLFQEVKSQLSGLPEEIAAPSEYHAFWHCGGRPGYSGVGAYVSRDLDPPLWTLKGIGVPEIDAEGRVLTLEFEDFFVVTAYFPNSGAGGRRLEFKSEFCRLMEIFCRGLRGRGKGVLLTGDFNIAPSDLDLHSVSLNRGEPGTLPAEVAWLNRMTDNGWVDVFRRDRQGEPGHYSWWSFFDDDRARNRGWRIDHALSSSELAPRLEAKLRPDIFGSDHCPLETLVRA